MQYLKKLVRQTYENVIIDDYIQPITTQRLYLILQNFKRLRKKSLQPNRLSTNQSDSDSEHEAETVQELCKTGYQFDQLFKRIGKQYNSQQIKEQLVNLSQSLAKIKALLTRNFPTYMANIQTVIAQTQQIVQITENTKPKMKQVKENLKRLEMEKSHNEKVTKLRLRSSNIKNLLSYLNQLPKINLMKISELKAIVIPERIKQLVCYGSLQLFIKQKVDEVHASIIQELKQILQYFQQDRYAELINRYYELGGVGVEIDKLIFGISSQMLRKFDVHYYDLCAYYVKFMANYHLICRWHHQFRVLDKYSHNEQIILNLKESIFELRKKIWTLMQEHLQHVIGEMIDLNNNEMFELMCQCNRFIEIGEHFSNLHVEKVSEQLLLKSIGMLNSQFESNFSQISQSLSIEESNEWSRMPVDNYFRYQPIDNRLFNILRKCQEPLYKEFTKNSFAYIQKNSNTDHNAEVDWTFKRFKFSTESNQLIRSRRTLTNLIELELKDQVVICQSVLPILKSIECNCEQLFCLRLVNEKTLLTTYFVTEYYIYFVFITFTPSRIRQLILGQGTTLEQKYQKCKLTAKFKNLIDFATKFKKQYNETYQLEAIKQSKQEKKILRSRVVSSQSLKYILAYLYYVMNNLRKVVKPIDQNWASIDKRILRYRTIGEQISILLYEDSVIRIASNINTIISPITKIRWDEQEIDLDQYRIKIQSFITEFEQKIKGLSKGEITEKIISQIFVLFCHYIVECVEDVYTKIKKINENGRFILKTMLEKLQTQFSIFPCNTNVRFTTNLIKLIEVANLEWNPTVQYLKQSVPKFEHSIKAYTQLLQISKSSDNTNRAKLNERQQEIIEIIKNSCN